MALFFRHTLFLFVLATICYALAIFITGGRIGFIVFIVVGLSLTVTVDTRKKPSGAP